MNARLAAAAILATVIIAGGVSAAAPAAPVRATAKQPATWTAAQKTARGLFAVLRKPGTVNDKLPGAGAKSKTPVAASRRVGTLNGKRFYLVLRSTHVCLAVTFSSGQPAGERCVPVAKVKARTALPQALEASASTIDFILLVPDGATVGRTIDGVTTPQSVAKNAALMSTKLGGSVDVTFGGGATLKLPLGVSL